MKNQQINPLKVNGHQYELFHRIRHVDRGAGFCALITYALNGTKKALENNWLPVVDFSNHDVNDFFYDSNYGENVWDYYFEPVMGISAATLDNYISDKQIDENKIHEYPTGQILRWHTSEVGRIATFWANDNVHNPEKWMKEKRALGRQFVQKYIRVKPTILKKVNDFYNAHLKGFNIIGVHIRGTDFAYAEPTKLEDYFKKIQSLDESSLTPYQKIFLATDQKQFVEAFKNQFGNDRLVTYTAARSESNVPVFLDNKTSPFKKGEDVLIDILLLSKSDYLLKGAAAVGEYAMWFNPKLDCTDFALKSQYDPTSSASAFLKMNLGETNNAQWKIQYFLSKVIRFIRNIKRPLLDFGMRIGKKIMPKSMRDFLWHYIFRHLYY